MDHDQRINVQFCFKPQKSAKETHEMLKLFYGDDHEDCLQVVWVIS
jgi:hypothetical protein